MKAPVVNLDVIAFTTSYLTTALAARPEPCTDGAECYGSVPNPRPARFVVVDHDGGISPSPIRDRPLVRVRVWATNEVEASDLARLTRALIHAAPEPVTNVEDVSGLITVPDQAPQPVRMFTVALTTYGQLLDLEES